ncbi:hypothetical protein ACFRCQ_08425 [Cytobacillus firmus]
MKCEDCDVELVVLQQKEGITRFACNECDIVFDIDTIKICE